MTGEIYFGRPGAPVILPAVRGGVSSTRARQTQAFPTGSGGARVSHAIDGRRQFTLNWQQLQRDDGGDGVAGYSTIEAYWHGHNGSGPWVLHDPARRNWLTVNQSGATALRNDNIGFSASGSIALGSSDASVNQGPRALAVSGLGHVLLDPAAPIWPGIPVVPGLALCFSFRVSITVTCVPQMAWLDGDGTLLSTSSGTATGVGSWSQRHVTAIPPANAAFVQPQLLMQDSTPNYLDSFQLELGSAPSDWRPGTGLYPISIVSLAEGWPWTAPEYAQNPTLVLQEVG